MSKRISNLSINGRLITTSEMAKDINILLFFVKQVIMTTECTVLSLMR